MTSYAQGWLYAANTLSEPIEIINHSRTLKNLRDWADACTGRFSVEVGDDACEGLAFQPCLDGESWVLDDFSDMSASPWWSSDPGATDALGFWINEWTGLDNAHGGRSTYSVGSQRGGARFGARFNRGRTWAMNITLFGTSERGLNYLFRWFESLMSGTCDPCGDWDFWWREYCPSDAIVTAPLLTDLGDPILDSDGDPILASVGVGDVEAGVAKAEGVVLLEGPTWSAPPLENAGCFMRNIEIVLGVSDPCMYRPPTSVVEETSLVHTGVTSTLAAGLPEDNPGAYVDCTAWDGTTAQVSSQITVPAYGAAGPKVKISSTYQENGGIRAWSPILRVTGFADPNGVGLDTCSLPRLGETMVARMPSGAELILDYARRRSYYRDLWADDPRWVDGSEWLIRQDEYSAALSVYQRWFSFSNCGSGWIVVEPFFDVFVNSSLREVDETLVTIDSTDYFGC